jgi:hypothetical protein
MSSVFFFNRDVTGDAGESLTQTVVVHARSKETALDALERQFKALRANRSSAERPYSHARNGWEIYEVTIGKADAVLNMFLTTRSG